MLWRAVALAAVGSLGACSSGSTHGSGAANASGGSVSLGSNGGAGIGGSSNSGGDGSGNSDASGVSGFSGGGAGGASAAGGANTASGGSSLDAGSRGGSSGSTGARGGSGGAASCTATVDVSVNDATLGTGVDAFDYAGEWSTSEAPEKFDGDDHYSATTGATATLHFDGISATFYAAKASHHGIATVSIDNGTPSDVDLYAATRADDVAVWNSGTLADAPHTLVVT
ncbi:MAG TPA: hypothetical protein VH142_14850, partial [Polyangiaceae bacterium]|nr:hypothetical protein [Polyangiaceae bacterium]